jgi:hypothetical protein
MIFTVRKTYKSLYREGLMTRYGESSPSSGGKIKELLNNGKAVIRIGMLGEAPPGFEHPVDAYDALLSYLDTCKKVDYVHIDVSEEENYALEIYDCDLGYVYYYAGTLSENSLVIARRVNDLKEAYEMWNEDIEEIANDIRERAANYASAEIQERLTKLAEEIESYKRNP